MTNPMMMSPPRPQATHASKSFSRLDTPQSSPQSSPLSRSRASTLQNGASPHMLKSELSFTPLGQNVDPQQDDIYMKDDLVDGVKGTIQGSDEVVSPIELPEDFDKLPIELMSLVDRSVFLTHPKT